MLPPLIAYSSIIGAGLAFPHNPETALFVVGAVALTLIFIGIHNAWDAVEYVAVQLRPNPRPEPEKAASGNIEAAEAAKNQLPAEHQEQSGKADSKTQLSAYYGESEIQQHFAMSKAVE